MASTKPLRLKREKIQLSREIAAIDPYVLVMVDHRVLHLDQYFEYLVPEIFSNKANVGSLVEIEFGSTLTQGIIVKRYSKAQSGGSIKELKKVLSTEPYLQEDQLLNVSRAADYYGSRPWDFIRSCVPAFSIMGERAYQNYVPDAPLPLFDTFKLPDALLSFLSSDSQILCAIEIPTSTKYWDVLSSVVATRLMKGSILLLVPNEREALLLEKSLSNLGICAITVLSSQGKSERYFNYLRSRSTFPSVTIGTRSTALYSLSEGATIILFDDVDESHYERQSPTWNSRELVQFREDKISTIYISASISLEIAQRVLNHELSLYTFPTPVAINVQSDSSRGSNNYFEVIREGLARGSVLISVGLTGYVTSFSCQKCRNIALCTCGGRLYFPGKGRKPICSICTSEYIEWKCSWCQGSETRIVRSGIERRVEEFGRAFPRYQVMASTAASPIPILPPGNHLVLSTSGVEPRGEYCAEIFLDLEARLLRTTLRATEEIRLQVFRNLTMLIQGGSVYFALQPSDFFLQSIIRSKLLTNAARDIEERNAVHLPPNFLAILITSENIDGVVQIFRDREGCELVGPFLRGGRKTILLKVARKQRQEISDLLGQVNRIQSMRKLPLMTYQINPYSLN